MKNIFVEGIQGSGKSMLINNIVKFNPELHVCREGDYSPIELAWCALMSKKEYEAVLQKYNSIRDEIIKNTYRTLMTRGMKGCYVYCTDNALAQYFKKLLKQK
mgnify:CR=1 FL=1